MNAYLYWGAVWESNADPFEANKMIGITKNANNKFTWDYCADYYAFRHFSEFIRPGYTRVASIIKGNQNIDNSAYLSDDGKTLVLVLINPDEEEKEQMIPEENFAIRNSEIYQSVLSIENPSKNKLYENIGDLGEEKLVTLPGESITTIVLSLE
jgi:glucuronoarabinoxylan endo-1,4-beta-xylanase